MKNVSWKFELSSYDLKSLWADILIYFVPVGMLALTQLQNTGSIDWSALYGLFISLIIKAWKKYITDYESKLSKLNKFKISKNFEIPSGKKVVLKTNPKKFNKSNKK